MTGERGVEAGDDASGEAGTDGCGSRTAVVRTTHADADLVASALAPDDTDSMAVRVDGDAIDCRIERPTTGGLRSTVDDYVVNLRVADRVIERAREHRTADGTAADGTAADGVDARETDARETDTRETNIRATDTRDADADTDTRHNT